MNRTSRRARDGAIHSSPWRFSYPEGPAASITGTAPDRRLGWSVSPVLALVLILTAGGCATTADSAADATADTTIDAMVETADQAKRDPVVVAVEAPAAEPVPEPVIIQPIPDPVIQLEPFVQEVADTTHSFEMIPVPAGTVAVPAETGEQEVVVGPFWISPTELTWELFDVFFFRLDRRRSPEGTDADAVSRPSRPYLPPDRGYGHDGYPTISISFHSAKTFCEWLSLKTGKTYRLPTEAEWRWVCERGGLEASALDDHAWHKGNSKSTSHPVAAKTPDANGIYDAWGNVAEWCTDLQGNPITLGGSFRDTPEALGCGVRVPPSDSWNDSDPQIPKGRWWLADCGWVGFRIVCEPNDEAETHNEQ